jgi:hypothetical protein
MFKSSNASNKNKNTKAEHTYLYSQWFIHTSVCIKVSIGTTFLTHYNSCPQKIAQNHLYNQDSISMTFQTKDHLHMLVNALFVYTLI